MYRLLVGTCLALLLIVSPVSAADIQVTDDLVFSLEIAQGWSLHINDPPAALVAKAASHVAHEPAAANATQQQIDRVARNRLLANEAIVYHSDSGAHLDIDFIPLEKDEKAPGSKTVKNSAEYAAESLAGEDDIKDVVGNVSSARIAGARDVYLLSASYLRHDLPMTFRGYVGFVADTWFFLYFTSPGNGPERLNELKNMLDTASIRVVEQ